MKRAANLVTWLLVCAIMILPPTAYAEPVDTQAETGSDAATPADSAAGETGADAATPADSAAGETPGEGTAGEPPVVQTVNPDDENKEFLNLFFDERVFRGEGSKQDSYFEIGRGLQALEGSYIDIYFTHSTTLLPNSSTLTVLLDDVPLTSVTLDNDNAEQVHLRAAMPASLLPQGFHKITVLVKMKVSILVCEDPSNSSAWLTIHRTSRTYLHVEQDDDNANLTRYPNPFVNRGAPSPINTIIAVPDELTEAEFKAAALLSQFLTRQTPDNRLNVAIYNEGEITDSLVRSRSIFWIGHADRWTAKGKAELQAYRTAVGDAWKGPAFIGVGKSTANDKMTNLFLSGNDQELLNGAEILSTESLFVQLQGVYSPIPAKLADPDESADDSADQTYRLTLAQLGYNNLVTESVLQGGSSFNYSLPNHWDLTNGATLHLVYKHSRSISFDKSVMTVRLNNVPIASVRLKDETGERGELDVKLDPSIIGNNRNLNIDIGFQFVNGAGSSPESAASTFCADTLLGDWAVIDKQTYFTFTPVARTRFNLDSMPFPFFTSDRWNHTTFVLKSRRSAELKTAMTLISSMGAPVNARSDIGLVQAEAPDLQERIKDRNIVYVGSSGDMPDFMQNFDNSYIAFSADSLSSRSEQVEILSELTQRSAVMQLTRSPLNAERSLLLMAATERGRLTSLARALTVPEKRGAILGRVIVVDSLDDVHNFPDTVDKVDEAVAAPVTKAPEPRPLPYGQYVFAGVLVLVVLILAVLIVKLRNRNQPTE